MRYKARHVLVVCVTGMAYALSWLYPCYVTPGGDLWLAFGGGHVGFGHGDTIVPVRWKILATMPDPAVSHASSIRLWFETQSWADDQFIVLVPLWCFSLAVELVLVGLPFVQTRRRKRRGQCVNCGYSRAGLAADAKCPECGVQ